MVTLSLCSHFLISTGRGCCSLNVNNGHWINDGMIVYFTFYDAYTVIQCPFHVCAPSVLRWAQFWYIRDCKMVLDSVACNNVSFSENHTFYCFLVHEASLTIDMQSSPYWSNSKQLGPGRMLLPHRKLLLLSLRIWLVSNEFINAINQSVFQFYSWNFAE